MKLKDENLKNIDTIIFDFGNVLLDIDIDITITQLDKLGLSAVNADQIHPNNAGIFLKLETGAISAEEFVETLQKSSSLEPSTEQILQAWNALLLPFDFKRFELLTELRKNYKIVLLSNTNEPHHNYFEKLFDNQNPFGKKFIDFFDAIYYSDELKLRKPDRKIYDVVQLRQRLEPCRTLFIDDTAVNLIEPKNMGWQTYNLKKPQTVFDLFD